MLKSSEASAGMVLEEAAVMSEGSQQEAVSSKCLLSGWKGAFCMTAAPAACFKCCKDKD